MGIQDRDYYREETRLPLAGALQACMVLIVAYVAVFILQIMTRDGSGPRRSGPVSDALSLQPDKVARGEVWRVVTHAFVHDPTTVAPIAFTIIFLLCFGRHMEDLYGWREFIACYLLIGLLGGVTFVLLAQLTGENPVMFGPQASVTAVLMLYALQYPRRTVLLLFVLPCPIWLLLVFNVLGNGTGFFFGKLQVLLFPVHALAAVLILVYHQFDLRLTGWWSGAQRVERRQQKPKLQIFREEPSDDEPQESGVPAAGSSGGAAHPQSAPAASSPQMDEQLEAKLDEVLEKVKKHGQESLTEEERSVLFRASEIYRRRRKTGGN